MNKRCGWRLEYARSVGLIYADELDVAAVLVGGSAARGHADRFSDVEVGVFWHRSPDDDVRRRVADRMRAVGTIVFPYNAEEQVWNEDYFIGRADDAKDDYSGLLVEVGSYTVAHCERLFDQVLGGGDPDILKQNLISGVLHGIVVKGHELLGGWKERCGHYPDVLVEAVICRHGQIDHFWRWRMLLERGNRMLFSQQVCDVQQRLLHMLLAVNRLYYFGFKWLPLVLDRLEHAPPDFARRFNRVSEEPPIEAAELLRGLVEDVYDVVELRVPRAPVARLRSIFRWERTPWGEDAPPYNPPPPAA